MNILRTSYTRPSEEVVRKASMVMRDCGLVVGITDTVYGVFTNPFRETCVEKVYKVKRREKKPIPVLASSLDDVLHVVKGVSGWVKELLKLLWPGPITVVLPVEDVFPENLHQGTGKVGFRVPASPLPRLLARSLNGFITGTSANISGLPPATTIDEAIKQLGEEIDLYIDSGTAPLRVPSTVIEVVDGGVRIIREGVVRGSTINNIVSWTMREQTV